MKAGTLRKRITIDAPTKAQDNYGQDIPTYAAVAVVWASIRPLRGQQLAMSQANTITALATHEVRIRYRNDLQIGFHRLRYGSGPTPIVNGSLSFETLTSAQFEALETSGTTTPTTTSGPRFFTINAIADTDERHQELVLTVTEVKG